MDDETASRGRVLIRYEIKDESIDIVNSIASIEAMIKTKNYFIY